jgi:hypothetical protein
MNLTPIFLKIADINCSIHSGDPTLKLKIDGASQKYLIGDTKPHLTVKACWNDLTSVESGKKIFDSGSIWQLHQENGTYLFSLCSPIFGSIPYKVAKTQKDFASVEVSLHRSYFNPDGPVYPLEYPLDELLLINFLALGRGVEVHACGVVDASGYGHLFIGQSGAGKTTMARLWEDIPDVTILSDDRIILRQMDRKLWMYGTPWHGEAMLASPDRAPLTRIYFLERGTENELLSLRGSVALGRLITCSFIPFHSKPGLAFTLGFFEEVVKEVPCCELRFVPDRKIVEFLSERTE